MPRPRRPLHLIIPALFFVISVGCQATPDVPPSSTAVAPPAPAVTSSGVASTPSVPKTPLEVRAVSGDRALEHVRQLAVTIGNRPTGTGRERQAADYIGAQLQGFGYQVEQQAFEFPWVEDQSSLTAGGVQLETGLVVRSARGEVTAELADAGDGNQPMAGSLTGKVALAERGGRTFEEKATEAARAGASALIVFNNRGGNFAGVMQNPSTIPVLAVSREDGLKLRDQLQRGVVRVELSAKSSQTTIKSQNVVGRGGSHCAIVIGGHYDSVPESPGASDNASGTAVMLEAARVAQPSAAARGLCFVAFGGEELGLHGSRAFVQSLDSDSRNFMLGMINLDMEGVGNRWKITGDDKLVTLGLAAAQGLGLEAERFELPRSVGSDHESFRQANIPAVYPAVMDDPLFHTPQDTADRISGENLQTAGRWTLAIVEALGR